VNAYGGKNEFLNLEYNLIILMQMVNNITILPSKFYQLKYLDICVPGQYFVPDYDFFSLASFLDASPSLETFILDFNVRIIFHIAINKYT